MPPTPKPWFRLYSDILDNLKVKQLKPALFRQWIELLALANLSRPRGSLPPMDIVAFRLRVNELVARAVVLELVARRLVVIEGDLYFMRDWDEWQKDRDVAPAKRGVVNHANVTLTPVDNHANVTQTIPVTVIENHAREEEEKEREKEKKRTEVEKTPEGPLLVLPMNIFRETERAFGRNLSAYDCDALKEIETEYPEETWAYALRQCSDANVKTLRYMRAVCEGAANGKPERADNRGQRGGGDGGAAQADANARATWALYGKSPTQYVDPWGDGDGQDGEHSPAPESLLEDGRGVLDAGGPQEAAELRRAAPAARGSGL